MTRHTRDLLFALTPALLIAIAAVWFAVKFFRPAPPDTIVITTGAPEGAYQAFAQKYRAILARDQVKLELRLSAGSVENLDRLRDPASAESVAFVQGGTGNSERAPGLVSLGSLYYEPLWIFYRAPRVLSTVRGLRGMKIAIGASNSGTQALALHLLEANDMTQLPTRTVALGGLQAVDALLEGEVGAALFVAAPDSLVVQRIVGAPGIRLMSLTEADAYTRRFPYLSRLILPKGVFDLVAQVPPQDITLLSSTANLVVKEELHPALAYLLLRAASEVHSRPGVFEHQNEFPAPRDADFPLSVEAQRYYRSGPPFLQRYLPYWGANLVERLWVMLLPVVAILFPLFRLVPPLYRWRVRSRIYRRYARLKEIELDLDEKQSAGALREMLERLDGIERAVNRIQTPLAYSENLYSFRQHIDLVRQRIQQRLVSASRQESG
jgi:TRAP transporter TAXI family solute receptor